MDKNFLKDYKDGVVFTGYARLLKKRDFGKISFWKVRFWEMEAQLFLQEGITERFQDIKKINLGSIFFFEGRKIVTKNGEPSIAISWLRIEYEGCAILHDRLNIASNNLSQSGNRVVDLIADKGLFDYFAKLSEIPIIIRVFLREHGFKEFTTGILQDYFEGGQADPFVTFCAAKSKPLFLSLTSELKLKRLMVAGFEKVYEISQSFRNEGLDKMHLPEFTLLELYAVNQSYADMMSLLEKMFREVIQCAEISSLEREGTSINFRLPFACKTFYEACLEFLGIPGEECTIQVLANKFPEIFFESMDEFTWTMKLVDKFFTPKIIQPTFLVDVPSGISPFAKKKPENEKLSESAFLIAMGLNLATISTDENNPEKVSELLVVQAKKTGRPINDDYINILKFGLPPTAGFGLGINRLWMLFQGDNKDARETCVLPIF